MFDFKITPDAGQPYVVTATPRDVLHWEKTTKGKNVGLLMEATSWQMVDMYKLAWIAARRQSLYAGTLPEFEASVEVDMDVDEDEDGEGDGSSDPTPPAPSATP